MIPIERHVRLASTQRLAVERARAGAPEGTTIVAETQTEGIGRLDHRWDSPRGGLYVSRILPAPPARGALLPLATALEIAEELERRWGAPTRVRWPNDLVDPVSGAKVAGVLAETIEGPRGPVVVLGVGLNADTDVGGFSPDLRSGVTTVTRLAGRWVRVGETEGPVLEAIHRATTSIASEAAGDRLVAALRTRLFGLGAEAALDGRSVGRIVGVDPDGALVTEREGRRSRHLAGTLVVRRWEPEPTAPTGQRL